MKKRKDRSVFSESVSVKRVLSSLVVAFAIGTIQAQEIKETPKLVVGITIDQLRGDYLETIHTLLGQAGFKRLMREGVIYHNVRFDFANVDLSSALATFYTGASPEYHGITGNVWYDYKSQKEVGSVNDVTYMGFGTHDYTAPTRIMTSSFTDELKEATEGKSDIFTFAPDKESAIISGGRTATAAFWIDDLSGKWCSSTYFGQLPWWFTKFVDNAPVPSRLNQLTWVPALPNDQYKLVMDKPASFTHPVNNGQFILFKNSPMVNTEINRLINECFSYAAIGKRGVTDYIGVTFSARNYMEQSSKFYPMEMLDTYIRLDREIEALLNSIDKHVGLNNALVFLTSTGYVDYKDPIDLKDHSVRGEFQPERCISLLNMYLMAIYGRDNWVEHTVGNQIYLNRKLIEEKKIVLSDIQDKCTEFLMGFSGIQNVVPSYKFINGNDSESMSRFKKGSYYKNVGDLIYEVQPGWVVKVSEKQSKQVRKDAFNFPLIFFGNGIVPEHIYRPVNATELAPTVSRIMRIRSPNASEKAPVSELKFR